MNKFYVTKGIQPPTRATKNSAGYDFFSPIKFTIPANDTSPIIDTGVSIKLDKDKVLLLFVRSSFGFKYGVTLVNGTGVIDADYFPNTIKCKFQNNSPKPLEVNQGDKILQGIIISYQRATREKRPTKVRVSGIGSTGK